ncbi:unnamed protein product [Timema podura]|uniref:Uncharacterized protein n=1 Tax=Timema podura TaxID=61482 RepID=A0ABN7NGT8_TIMPD|nr:unnamed protein product [Timema podura]
MITTLADWAARVQHLTSSCMFGTNLEFALLDKFVMGIQDKKVKERLFTEDPIKLTISKAREIAQQGALKKNVLQNSSGSPLTVWKQRKGREDRKHLVFLNLYQSEAERLPFSIEVTLNGVKMIGQLETGATCSAMSERLYKKHFQGVRIIKKNEIVKFYTKDLQMIPLGRCSLPVVLKGQVKQIDFHVIPNGVPLILGKDFINVFGLKFSQVNQLMMPSVDLKNKMIQMYPEVFTDKLGTFNRKFDFPQARMDMKCLKLCNLQYFAKYIETNQKKEIYFSVTKVSVPVLLTEFGGRPRAPMVAEFDQRLGCGEGQLLRKFNQICRAGEWKTILEKTTLSTPDRDLNLDLSVVGSLVYRNISALDHAVTGSAPMKVEFRGSEPTFAWRESRKSFRNPRPRHSPSSPDLDSNLDLPVLGSLAQHETSALANYTTELHMWEMAHQYINETQTSHFPQISCSPSYFTIQLISTSSAMPEMFGTGEPIKSQNQPSQISVHAHLTMHAFYNQKQAQLRWTL